jgi:nucleoside-diphosphate-sugar epimerase
MQLILVFLLFTFLIHVCSCHVLLLGSGGTIGKALKIWLKQHGYSVQEVLNRNHIDLRRPNALASFQPASIDFVLFLACEVGGAKFIAGLLLL